MSLELDTKIIERIIAYEKCGDDIVEAVKNDPDFLETRIMLERKGNDIDVYLRDHLDHVQITHISHTAIRNECLTRVYDAVEKTIESESLTYIHDVIDRYFHNQEFTVDFNTIIKKHSVTTDIISHIVELNNRFERLKGIRREDQRKNIDIVNIIFDKKIKDYMNENSQVNIDIEKKIKDYMDVNSHIDIDIDIDINDKVKNYLDLVLPTLINDKVEEVFKKSPLFKRITKIESTMSSMKHSNETSLNEMKKENNSLKQSINEMKKENKSMRQSHDTIYNRINEMKTPIKKEFESLKHSNDNIHNRINEIKREQESLKQFNKTNFNLTKIEYLTIQKSIRESITQSDNRIQSIDKELIDIKKTLKSMSSVKVKSDIDNEEAINSLIQNGFKKITKEMSSSDNIFRINTSIEGLKQNIIDIQSKMISQPQQQPQQQMYNPNMFYPQQMIQQPIIQQSTPYDNEFPVINADVKNV